MFGFGKVGKTELANRIVWLSDEAAKKLVNYLKEDKTICDKCMDLTQVKNGSNFFMINLYREILTTKYDDKDVYLLMRYITQLLSSDKAMVDIHWNALMGIMKCCYDAMQQNQPVDSLSTAKVLTETYFSLFIADPEYAKKEMKGEISNSISYKNICNYLCEVWESKALLKDSYRMKLR